jgi:hypothetical protein
MQRPDGSGKSGASNRRSDERDKRLQRLHMADGVSRGLAVRLRPWPVQIRLTKKGKFNTGLTRRSLTSKARRKTET